MKHSRHIQYNRTAKRRPIATLAMLLLRRIARCIYRRFPCGLKRTAACAPSSKGWGTSVSKNSLLRYLLPALESSLGVCRGGIAPVFR
jgi:hypothetical protein